MIAVEGKQARPRLMNCCSAGLSTDDGIHMLLARETLMGTVFVLADKFAFYAADSNRKCHSSTIWPMVMISSSIIWLKTLQGTVQIIFLPVPIIRLLGSPARGGAAQLFPLGLNEHKHTLLLVC